MPTQTFTTGEGWWTVPINVSTVVAECWGGGGNGGDGDYDKGAGGGGGGAYAKRTFKLYQGHSYWYAVGNAQDPSHFRKANSPPANRCMADAGVYGIGTFGGYGGSAAECEGDVCYSGGNGGGGYNGPGAGGGGGGAAGDANNGGTGGNGTFLAGGSGGVGGINGGGNGGTGGWTSNPVAGSAPGGGGGGGTGVGSAPEAQSGASGAKGQVKLTWTVDTNIVLMNSILE